MKGSIYIIKNTINDKVYIGQTIQSVERRFNKHKNDSLKDYGVYKTNKFYRAIKKYGFENFYYEILEDNINEERLDEREIYWIKYYNSYENGYNSTLGGQATRNKYDRDKIRDLWNKGYCTSQIINDIGISLDTLLDILHEEFNISTDEIRERSNINKYKFDDNTLLEYWNNGEGINQIVKNHGGNRDSIKKRLSNLGITKQEIFERSKQNRAKAALNNKQNEKPVYQLSLDGKILNKFNSIKEASDFTGAEKSVISRALSGHNKTAGGYMWSLTNSKEEIQEKIKRKNQTNKKIVYQYDLNWNYINQYESIAAAAKAVGLKSASTLSAACHDNTKTAKGYKWSFENYR